MDSELLLKFIGYFIDFRHCRVGFYAFFLDNLCRNSYIHTPVSMYALPKRTQYKSNERNPESNTTGRYGMRSLTELLHSISYCNAIETWSQIH